MSRYRPTDGDIRTLRLGALSTTVEVLASVLGDPDVVASLVAEVLDVGLEVGSSNIVPVEGQEAGHSVSQLSHKCHAKPRGFAGELTHSCSRRQSFRH